MLKRCLRIAFLFVFILALVGSVVGVLVSGPLVVGVESLPLSENPSVERLERDVRHACEAFGFRNFRNTEGLERLTEWIAEEMRSAGLNVRFQEYETSKGTFRNVIGRRSGRNKNAGLLVVGAHYDAYGEMPAANDNASGLAVLLELVRTLPQRRPRSSQLFVAFGTEEPPFFGSSEMGSYAMAERLHQADVPIDLMVSLDVVGHFTEEPDSQRFPISLMRLLYPTRGNFLAVIGDHESGAAIARAKRGLLAARSIPVHSFRAPPTYAPIDLSDHWSFRRFDYPAVQVTDTAFMRYDHYHEPTDTPEKLNYEQMARVVSALQGLVWE